MPIHGDCIYSPDVLLRGVVVLCTIVHDQAIIDKVEAVRTCLPRGAYQSLFPFVVKLRCAVDHLPCVPCARNDERQRELEGLDEHVPEVMALDHHKVVKRFVSDGELQVGADGVVVQELWAEVVPDEAGVVIQGLNWGCWHALRPCHLKKRPRAALVQGPNPEAAKVDALIVRNQRAKETLGWSGQASHILRCCHCFETVKPRVIDTLNPMNFKVVIVI